MSNHLLKEITMKNAFTTTALILAAGLTAGASFAADSAPRSRADVRAEVLEARVNGTLPVISDAEGQRTQAWQSGKLTRAEVKAEYFQAQKDGTLRPIAVAADVYEKFTPSTLTRAAVKAEYFQAQKAGTLPSIGEGS